MALALATAVVAAALYWGIVRLWFGPRDEDGRK